MLRVKGQAQPAYGGTYQSTYVKGGIKKRFFLTIVPKSGLMLMYEAE